ncbi:30S ribosomal protein S16 [Candidatus Beckwithbacteria bacterium RBG_13_42_9]|uniref:Small ribosomal subunit protein bS16 n=1 Tax=Candidatus Beckwithbacteria bacterium RBG_13_42_9 TaxID=1797457 RepID=A0A1F5E5P1_9BACT|nr:MAG: 30S ribosomal protein S16 [Candidatus Beckwithbacteria bacterium RBG_13_42_9]
MLKIKLFRLGKKKQPRYRIVVAERRDRCGGKYVSLLGTYNPLAQPAEIKLDLKKYQEWLTKGAQPTATVKSLYQKAQKKS